MAESRTSDLGTDRSQPVTAEAALLQGLLDGPSFGLDLIERIKHKTQGQVSLLQGTVYPLLQRLAERGWLQGHAGQPGGGRPRRYYKLTAAGRRAARKQAGGQQGSDKRQ